MWTAGMEKKKKKNQQHCMTQMIGIYLLLDKIT